MSTQRFYGEDEAHECQIAESNAHMTPQMSTLQNQSAKGAAQHTLVKHTFTVEGWWEMRDYHAAKSADRIVDVEAETAQGAIRIAEAGELKQCRVVNVSGIKVTRAPAPDLPALLAERDRLRDALIRNQQIARNGLDSGGNVYLSLNIIKGESEAALSGTSPSESARLREVNAELRKTLVHADYTFDLLAGYGLLGEDASVCFSCMKEIATEAKRRTSDALAKAQGKAGT